MRKNGDFVFLRPVLRLGIGMMAALCERTISFTFDESGSAPADNTGDSNSSAGGDTTPTPALTLRPACLPWATPTWAATCWP